MTYLQHRTLYELGQEEEISPTLLRLIFLLTYYYIRARLIPFLIILWPKEKLIVEFFRTRDRAGRIQRRAPLPL